MSASSMSGPCHQNTICNTLHKNILVFARMYKQITQTHREVFPIGIGVRDGGSGGAVDPPIRADI